MGEAKKVSLSLQALIDLSNMDITPEQEQDPNLPVVMDMLCASPELPAWEHVRSESAEIKTLWSQYFSLKIRDGVLLRCRKIQGSLNERQVVAPQTIRTGPACKKTWSRGVNSAPSVINARRLPGAQSVTTTHLRGFQSESPCRFNGSIQNYSIRQQLYRYHARPLH